MQSANQEPVEFFHPRIACGRGPFFLSALSSFLLGAPEILGGRRFRRPAPEHVRFECFKRGRVSGVIELVRIGANDLPDPFLEERFLLELS